MRKSKYGVSTKAVADALRSKGIKCSERAALGALKWYAEDETRFSSARVAADVIAGYKREHGRFPRNDERKSPKPVQPDALEREVGHAILLLRRLGFKVEVA